MSDDSSNTVGAGQDEQLTPPVSNAKKTHLWVLTPLGHASAGATEHSVPITKRVERVLTVIRRSEGEMLTVQRLPTKETVRSELCLLNDGGTKQRSRNGLPVWVSYPSQNENGDLKELYDKHYLLEDNNGGQEPRDAQSKIEIQLLLDSLRDRSDPFSGTLIIVVPEEPEELKAQLARLLRPETWAPVIQQLLRIENRKPGMDAEGFPLEDELPLALAVAQYVVRNGGTSLIVTGNPSDIVSFEPVSPEYHPVRYFSFHITRFNEFTEKYLGSLTLRRKASITFPQRRAALDRFRSLDLEGWREWGIDPDEEVHRLLEFEFTDPKAFEVFDQICREASDQYLRRGEYSRFHRILLTAVRLSKSLANKTLEGTPFDFTIFIPKVSARKQWLQACLDNSSPDGSPLNPVASLLSKNLAGSYQVDDWVYYNFDYENAASNLAELSQSPALSLLVDPETGLVTHLLQKESTFTFDPLRYLQFENFFSSNSGEHVPAPEGVFVQGHHGRVEIHAKSDASPHSDTFRLEFNGSRWNPEPLAAIRGTASDYFANGLESAEGNETQARRKALKNIADAGQSYNNAIHSPDRIMQAVATLLLQHKSSLIVLCSQSDLRDCIKQWEENSAQREDVNRPRISIVAMRPNVEVIMPLERMNPSALAGLLQVDGLHIFTPAETNEDEPEGGKGYILKYFAHLVQLGEASPGRGTVGSGTSTAIKLAQLLKDSKTQVIKVSASGSVKIPTKGHESN